MLKIFELCNSHLSSYEIILALSSFIPYRIKDSFFYIYIMVWSEVACGNMVPGNYESTLHFSERKINLATAITGTFKNRRRQLTTANGNVTFLWRRHCACTTRSDLLRTQERGVSRRDGNVRSWSFILTPFSLLSKDYLLHYLVLGPKSSKFNQN